MIQLPEFFSTRLSTDLSMRNAVDSVLTTFSPWIENSHLPFFPEYTDHGPQHIEDVLLTEEGLIADAAKKCMGLITAADIAMLTIATVLHDAAMHLTEHSFQALLDPKRPILLSPAYNAKPWAQLWNDYLLEAKRWQPRKIGEIFGKLIAVREPNFGDLSESDRFLIGEFIRRHHARLAHEIAIDGVPGTNEQMRIQNLNARQCNLCGLIAHSHWLPMRDAVDLFRKEYDNPRSWSSVHAPYLMTLLRVADYLQIQSQRAPKAVLLTHKLRSPISQREWRVHQSIQDIRSIDDPEAIYIEAEPPDVVAYLRIKEWLQGFQAELDASWSVLGEVYARYAQENFNLLGLSLRRVRSNLDNEATFASSSPYLPKDVHYKTSDAELIKLLIRPLYGDQPYPGVRELLQNSLDAVRTRRDLETASTNPPPNDTDREEAEVTIRLWKDNEKFFFTITDCGVGMSADEVRDYFLTAGATLRKTEKWRQLHEDEQGHSRVLRTGKFGIGALAAFLLGDEIEVITRKYGELETSGITFKTRIETEHIQLNRTDAAVGTTVTISLSESTFQDLEQNYDRWDWYCLTDPKVIVHLPNNITKTPCSIVPALSSESKWPWHRLTSPHFERIDWGYIKQPVSAVNGIKISNNAIQRTGWQSSFNLWKNRIDLVLPSLSIYDRDGSLQVDISRSNILEMPFKLELLDDIYKDFLAHLLIHASNNIVASYGLFKYLGATNRHEYNENPSNFVFCREGFTLMEGSGSLQLQSLSCMRLL